MCRWYIEPECVTSTGYPKEFHSATGPEFVLIAVRCSGPDDHIMPRRVYATGSTRWHAQRSLDRTIGAYDPSWTVVAAPERPIREDV